MRKNSKTLFTVFLLFCASATSVLAAECQTQTGTVATPANYNNASTWSCGRVPTTGWPGPDNVTINHPIYYTGDMSAAWVSQTITINSGGSLKISGNLNLQGNSLQIIVNGGTLEVGGTITLDNQPTITVQNNGVVKAGSMTMANSAKYINTSGTLTLTGNLNVPTGNTFTYGNTLAVPGNLTLGNGITLGASTVGGSIDLSGGSKLNLTTSAMIAPPGISLAGNAELNFSGGTLNYAGTLSIPGGSKVTMSSGNLNVQSLMVAGTFSRTGGTLSLTSHLTINSGSTFMYTPSLNIPGNVSINNGATVTASNAGGSITLTNSSKLLLTTAPSATISPSNISIGGGSELVYSGGTLNYNNPLTIGSNAKLTVSSGNFKPQSLTIDAGNVTVSGGNLAVTNAITFQNNNATLNFNSSGVLSAGSVSMTTSGGNKSLNLTAGTMVVTNGVDIQAGSTINTSAGTTSSASSLTVGDNASAILNNSGTFTVNGNVSTNGKINNNGNMHITGSLNGGTSGNSIFTNNGKLNVNSVSMTSSARFQVNPGATTFVDTNFTVNATQNLVIGTNANPPPYADMVIRGNLVSTNGGDVLVERNARVAIFGGMTGEGSGDTQLTINPGGEVYIDKSITFNGGGDKITNNNPSTPNNYGLYVDGTITNTGGGAQTTSNYGDKNFMESSNKPFFDWVSGLPNSPLPVVLTYFRFGAIKPGQIPLQWATTLEKNFDHFEVERAAEALNFTTIATVAGEGNEHKGGVYTFVDNAPLGGWNYYRLKQVDLDGTVVYSDVIRTRETESSSSNVSLYPNPVRYQQVVTLSLQDRVTTPAMLTFIDGAGRVLLTMPVDASVTAIPLPVNLTAGVYAVRLASASGQKLFHLVIQ
ncbi:hypothetical protein KK062_19425 [Fulvivirgaceae bacterium PWU5]|uniref:T9SS type A sorting domain-containing protein n=1 Tax=Dawidia cretensis TaxID=2782350 RepID=A0AAP2E1N9_9BACT|nr:hypothetical protein [Dawidia cretensis]MBT1710424.1 hypothetical protein [Dawidia cretensis]